MSWRQSTLPGTHYYGDDCQPPHPAAYVPHWLLPVPIQDLESEEMQAQTSTRGVVVEQPTRALTDEDIRITALEFSLQQQFRAPENTVHFAKIFEHYIRTGEVLDEPNR